MRDTVMKELRDKLLVEVQNLKEASQTNEHLKGYREALKNVANDIDAQMMRFERQKVFKEDGDLLLRFAADAKEQIVKWLDGIDYDYAVQYAKAVDCPVFGKALEFPCVVV